MQPAPETERDSAALLADFPGNGQTGLQGLGLPIQADQDTAGKVANRFRGLFVDQEWIESFRLAAETEMEFAAGLAGGFGADESRPTQDEGETENRPNAAYHCV